MVERKQVLLRLDPAVHDALQRWASDELRSVNAQIEVLLRRELQQAVLVEQCTASLLAELAGTTEKLHATLGTRREDDALDDALDIVVGGDIKLKVSGREDSS